MDDYITWKIPGMREIKRTGLVVMFVFMLAGCSDYLDNYAECRTFTKHPVKSQINDVSVRNDMYRFCRKNGIDPARERLNLILSIRNEGEIKIDCPDLKG